MSSPACFIKQNEIIALGAMFVTDVDSKKAKWKAVCEWNPCRGNGMGWNQLQSAITERVSRIGIGTASDSFLCSTRS